MLARRPRVTYRAGYLGRSLMAVALTATVAAACSSTGQRPDRATPPAHATPTTDSVFDPCSLLTLGELFEVVGGNGLGGDFLPGHSVTVASLPGEGECLWNDAKVVGQSVHVAIGERTIDEVRPLYPHGWDVTVPLAHGANLTAFWASNADTLYVSIGILSPALPGHSTTLSVGLGGYPAKPPPGYLEVVQTLAYVALVHLCVPAVDIPACQINL